MLARNVAPTAQDANSETRLVDRDQIREFLALLFCDARPGEGVLASRDFAQMKLPKDDPRRFADTDWVLFDPGDMDAVVKRLGDHAQAVARKSGESARVYAPPVCLFYGGSLEKGQKRTSGESDVVFAPALAVDFDASPATSLARLRAVLGEPTVIVASGGVTSDGEDKVHAYWRLREPARSVAAIGALSSLRTLAARLAGADDTGGPVSHPFRWPGGVHTKGSPTPCRIVSSDPARCIDFADAKLAIEAACVRVGVPIDERRASSVSGRDGRPFKTKRALPPETLQIMADGIPNDVSIGWKAYRHFGLIVYDASHGTDDGKEALHTWAAKASNYDPDEVDASWSHFASSPPDRVSAASLWFHLRRHKPEAVAEARQWVLADIAEDPDPVAKPLAEGIFDGLDDMPGAPAVEPPRLGAPKHIAEMNERHAIVMHKGRTFVVTEEDDRRVYESPPRELELRYADRKLTNDKQTISRYEAWIASPHRRVYPRGWTFDPSGDVADGVFNRWRGFPRLQGEATVNASGAGCALILAHIRDVVCSGNAEHADYLLNWLAHLVQRPGEKPGVAVVLISDEGSGKDTVGNYAGKMMPGFYINSAQRKHLTGAFNAHMATCLLFHMEELAWNVKDGDDSQLKSLITSPNQIEEGKGINADPDQKSFLRLLVTTNAAQAVPASLNARRYFVLRVSDAQRQNEAYFAAIRQEMNGTGPAALRKYLGARNLSGFNVRRFPMTEALTDQKRASLAGFALYWHELIETGGAFPEAARWEEEAVEIEKDVFFRDYERWSRDRRVPVEVRAIVGVKLSAFTKLDSTALVTQKRVAGGQRIRNYVLPPLPALRDAFGL